MQTVGVIWFARDFGCFFKLAAPFTLIDAIVSAMYKTHKTTSLNNCRCFERDLYVIPIVPEVIYLAFHETMKIFLDQDLTVFQYHKIIPENFHKP